MPQEPELKICLIGECLSTGGAERTMAVLSRYFASMGITVKHVIVIDSIVYDYSGEVLNLGKYKDTANGIFNKAKRFRILRKFLAAERFDHIIDFRTRTSFVQEYFISRFLYNAPTTYTVHSAMLEWYFPKKNWQARLVYRKAHGIVAVSQLIEDIILEILGLENAVTIPNPIDPIDIDKKSGQPIAVGGPFIVAAGSMKTAVKQFDKLISAYARSVLPQKNVRLVLLGDGLLRPQLEQLATQLGLSGMVLFEGNVANPYAYFSKALFLVLSSRNEGLPTVLLESLACGKPVISFDCVSGPNEIIVHEHNGLLVKDQDIDALMRAMDRFAQDNGLYEKCRQNAKESVARFHLSNIGKQWLDYLKIEVS
jgi:N-acetylgalactosamine-N,N'-diacetylbacillosaminyl-diphospho-undecaprenol 4-alpha-N-acetylgalactosaminyltransferase